MRKKKKFSLFEKLTGSIHMDDFEDELLEDEDSDLYDSLDGQDDFEEFDDELYTEEQEEVKSPKKSTSARAKVTPSAPVGQIRQKPLTPKAEPIHEIKNSLPDHEEEIPVDIIETTDTIYIRTEITGVDPDTVDIDLTRDTLVLSAIKKERRSFGEDEYSHKEIYWGDVGRSLELPDEVEVEEAEAHAEFGILLITLPKIDKARKTKLRVGTKKKTAVRKT